MNRLLMNRLSIPMSLLVCWTPCLLSHMNKRPKLQCSVFPVVCRCTFKSSLTNIHQPALLSQCASTPLDLRYSLVQVYRIPTFIIDHAYWFIHLHFNWHMTGRLYNHAYSNDDKSSPVTSCAFLKKHTSCVLWRITWRSLNVVGNKSTNIQTKSPAGVGDVTFFSSVWVTKACNDWYVCDLEVNFWL